MLNAPTTDEALLQAGVMQQQYLTSIIEPVGEATYDDEVMNMHNSMLVQQAGLPLHSSTGSPNPGLLALDHPNMLAFQDSSGQLWSANAIMPPLNTATDQMAELQLVQSSTATSSPIAPADDYLMRRTSVTSNQDLAEWQDKARTERRKVQNRAAQRAYRERKEKALCEMRELLEQKETQLQALQQDHDALKEKYEDLLSTSQANSTASDVHERGSTKITSSDPSTSRHRNISQDQG